MAITSRALVARINKAFIKATWPKKKYATGEYEKPKTVVRYQQIRETNDHDAENLEKRGKYYLVNVRRTTLYDQWKVPNGYETIESYAEGHVDLQVLGRKLFVFSKTEKLSRIKSDRRSRTGRDT